ncbi:MAG: LON peptidase substrate-binding domain-containing protein [Vicinamibacteria bacterium]|nr:LON peptidase substrate-binding domain-containing protein [Vicinamibacteria bacterium]
MPFESSPDPRHQLLPIIPLRDAYLFPESSLTSTVMRVATLRSVDIALRAGGRIFAVAQLDPNLPAPGARDLHAVGTIAEIVTKEEQSEGYHRVELDGLTRGRIHNIFGLDTLIAEVEQVEEGDPGEEWGAAVEALARYIHAHTELKDFLDKQRLSNVPMAWVNLACQYLPIAASARYKLLEANAAERCQKIGRGLDALLRKEQGA